MTMDEPPTEDRGGRAAAAAGVGQRLLELHGLAVIIGWVLALFGGVVAVLGYVSVSGTADVVQQVNRLASTSIAGLALVGVGGAVVLTSHYRRTVDALLDLRDDLADRAPSHRDAEEDR
jgi:hypothetical protein